MSKKILFVISLFMLVAISGLYYVTTANYKELTKTAGSEQFEPTVPEADTMPASFAYTERYSGRIDRVEVVFEHKDYIQYQLRTNGRVQIGDLNTERGFETDEDATVYVLNWQEPVEKQMAYVRLTAEPGRLYLLDSERKIVKGSVLNIQP